MSTNTTIWNPIAGELEKPLNWKKPRMVFVNSMSDLFHDDVPFEFIDKVFAVMALCPQHTFQILTKRPERMAKYIRALSGPHGPDPRRWDAARRPFYESASGRDKERIGVMGACPRWPLPGVWLGTSVENHDAACARIPHLLQCPAAVRFLSVEPLLGELGYIPFWDEYKECQNCGTAQYAIKDSPVCACESDPEMAVASEPVADWKTIVDRIHWIIVGGESGPGARVCKIEWIRSVVQQCKDAGVPVYVKQLGKRPVLGGKELKGLGPKGDNADLWPDELADLKVREFPKGEDVTVK